MHANDLHLRDSRNSASWNPDAAYERAVSIGERLVSLAIRSGDGVTWRGLLAGETESVPILGMLDSDFYDGTTGIGLFLLALARKTGRAAFHETGRQAFAPLQRRLAGARAFDQPERVLGGAEGLTSCLYPLVVGAALGDWPELLDCAAQLARQLTTEVIEADRQFDLIAGAAGTTLGLLALHEAGRSIGLEKAMLCGRHLLRSMPPPSRGAKPVLGAGLARGASGLALALARLGRAAQDVQFLDAAAAWIAYEDTLFDRTYGNWSDRRPQEDAPTDDDFTACSWCRGGTGIGFARLGMPRQTGLDMTRAIRRTITEPLADSDSLCCGNFGRISFLLEAGIRLDRPELIAQARSRAAQQIAEPKDAFPWIRGSDSQNLGFFQGVSGVAYELLRLLDPHLVPCALLWEVESGTRVAMGEKKCA